MLYSTVSACINSAFLLVHGALSCIHIISFKVSKQDIVINIFVNLTNLQPSCAKLKSCNGQEIVCTMVNNTGARRLHSHAWQSCQLHLLEVATVIGWIELTTSFSTKWVHRGDPVAVNPCWACTDVCQPHDNSSSKPACALHCFKA